MQENRHSEPEEISPLKVVALCFLTLSIESYKHALDKIWLSQEIMYDWISNLNGASSYIKNVERNKK